MTKKDYIRRNLIELRVQHGLSQEQLAQLVNVAQGTISRIESGVNEITMNLLFKLLRIYKVDLVLQPKKGSKP